MPFGDNSTNGVILRDLYKPFFQPREQPKLSDYPVGVKIVNKQERIDNLREGNWRLVEQLATDHLAYRNDMTRMLITIEHLVTVIETSKKLDMEEIAILRSKNNNPQINVV
jgi:hypothetical protein